MYERARQLGLSVRMEQSEPLTVIYHIGEEYSSTGTGATKHAAKEKAAAEMLEILPIPEEKVKTKPYRKPSHQHKKFIEQKGSNNYSLSEKINPIARLYQIARARGQKVEFLQMETGDSKKGFRFHVQIGESDCAAAHDKNKKAAKRLAAENLLSKLNPDLLESVAVSLPPPPKKGLLKREESAKKQQEKKHVHFVDDQPTARKQQLSNACEKLNIRIQYEEKMMADQYESVLSLSKDNRLLAKFRGHAFALADAEENAAAAAWKNLQELFRESTQTPIRE